MSLEVDVQNLTAATTSLMEAVNVKKVELDAAVTEAEGFATQAQEKVVELADGVSATNGSAMVGYDGGTVQTVLDNVKALADYTALRAYTGRATGVRITTKGFAGFFQRDISDTTSVDNGGTIIVDASNRRWKRLYSGVVDVKWFGATGDGVTDDTAEIQAAIDFVFSNGGGVVFIPSGTYVVSQTTQTLTVLLVSSGGALNPTNTTTQACLILRSGVTLVGAGRKETILSAQTGLSRTVISLYDMSSGGVKSLTCKGGKGVMSHVSDFSADMCELVIDDLEIYDSIGYGLGMQYGLYRNNRYSRLYIHDTGQDALDHKCKPREGTGEVAYGLTFTDILCERYGQTSTTESAGIDVRGLAQLNNIVCRDFNRTGYSNIGIRFSTGIWLGNDHRIGSHKSTLSTFYIDSGDASGDSVGISLLEASEICIVNGVIENCKSGGVETNNTVTGNGSAQNNTIIGVTVFGTRETSFKTDFPNTTFIGCKALQAEDYFSENRGNLIAGQTALVVERTFDPAIVRVYKNSTLLTLTTDYTVSGTDTINLVAAAVATDVFMVATPGSTGFVLSTGSEDRIASNCTIVGCSTKGMTTQINADATCLATLTTSGNNFAGGANTLRTSYTGPYIEALGISDNVDIELRPKGSGNSVLRANSARALVAANSTSTSVNWVEVRGSQTGNNVRVSAQGSDANANLELMPKGTGTLVTAAREYASDAAAAAGGVPINGIYRDASGTLKIRLT